MAKSFFDFCKFKRLFGLHTFIFFSLRDFTLESNAHFCKQLKKLVTGTQNLDTGILSRLMNLTIGSYSISNLNLA